MSTGSGGFRRLSGRHLIASVFAIMLVLPAMALSQSKAVIDAAKAAKAAGKREVTIDATYFAEYGSLGPLADVPNNYSGLILKPERIAALSAWWPGRGDIVTWHTFTVESIVVKSRSPSDVDEECHQADRLGFAGLDLGKGGVAIYFPGGSLPLEGVVVHMPHDFWTPLTPKPGRRYLVFGKLCATGYLRMVNGQEDWYDVSADGRITSPMKTAFSNEVVNVGTVQRLRERFAPASR